MNQGPSQDMYYSSHLSGGPQQAPQTATAGISHYPHHQQPPLLQPGPGPYQPSQPYSQYGYAHGLASPQSAGHPMPGSMGPQGNVLPLPGLTAGGSPYQPGPNGFDTTGQVAPPNMKPRVTATLWEDEGSLCFQVEAKGICVARREDNHMINGTKLLNVAGMTRGRRDGILKSEKQRHVVKIGPMHLKGVWIPFERALDFANKEKITELLYPLFVHNIGALLYHPTNENRTNAVMAAQEKRRADLRNSQASGLPTLHQHHHHSMHSSIGGGHLSGPQHSLAPHPGMPRPVLDRAHTFPTPPTSASSVMGTMEGPSGNFQWSGQNMSNVQGGSSLSIDTGLSNARSMPTTPATTPPGTGIPNLQYQQASQSQPYENSRQIYSTSQQQNSYSQPQSNGGRYGQADSYIKNEMGPPGARAPGSGSEAQHHDSKGANGILHHGQDVGHGPGDEEAEHEHDAEYTHDANPTYDSSRGTYNYAPTTSVGSLPAEHAHLAQEMNGSPGHQGGSGRATPRTTTASQPGYYQHGSYTPPRGPPPSSNLFNTMSSERGTASDRGSDLYASGNELGGPLPNGFSSQLPSMNGGGGGGGAKRRRDDDDEGPRPVSRGPPTPGELDAALKRRKTLTEGSLSDGYETSLNRTRSTISQRRR